MPWWTKLWGNAAPPQSLGLAQLQPNPTPEKTAEREPTAASAPSDFGSAALADRIQRGAAGISVFPESQAGNAKAQARLYSSWASSHSGLDVYLLEAVSKDAEAEYLLVKVGTRQAQWDLTNASRSRDLDILQWRVLTSAENAAISQAPCYENFAQPGYTLSPSGTLDRIVGQIRRGDYRVAVIPYAHQPLENRFTPGHVVAWGWNEDGQVSVPDGLEDVQAIAAGSFHNLALRKDGTVVAWGRNKNIFADVLEAATLQSRVPDGLSEVIAVAAGGYHSLALRADGTVVAWGSNRLSGQNSHGGQTDVPSGLKDVIAIAAGHFHSVALRKDGTAVAWGTYRLSDAKCQVPDGVADVTAIAAGGAHMLALNSKGKVTLWGDDHYGKLILPQSLDNVVAMAAGDGHDLALKNDGSVIGWGSNTDGNSWPSGQAKPPADLAGVTAIAVGGHHSLAICKDGSVRAWGSNKYTNSGYDSQAGQTDVPAGLTGVRAIAAGDFHSLALL
jgi:hypothetical protein